MGFGNSSNKKTDNYGMAIGTSLSSDTSTDKGAYSWVQLIGGVAYIWTDSEGKQTSCSVSAGLDTQFPYSLGSYVNPSVIGLQSVVSATSDQPKIDLTYYHPNAVQVSTAFSAEMFLMWQSNTLPSIPVPLGSVVWSFSEASVKDANSPNGWTTPTVKSSNGAFSTKNPTYPVWKSLATTKPNNC